jgi:hypothetical protein
MLRMKRADVVCAAAKDVQSALESGPAQGRKACAETATFTNQPANLGRLRIQHGLIGKAHQELARHGVPKTAASFYNAAAAKLEESG